MELLYILESYFVFHHLEAASCTAPDHGFVGSQLAPSPGVSLFCILFTKICKNVVRVEPPKHSLKSVEPSLRRSALTTGNHPRCVASHYLENTVNWQSWVVPSRLKKLQFLMIPKFGIFTFALISYFGLFVSFLFSSHSNTLLFHYPLEECRLLWTVARSGDSCSRMTQVWSYSQALWLKVFVPTSLYQLGLEWDVFSGVSKFKHDCGGEFQAVTHDSNVEKSRVSAILRCGGVTEVVNVTILVVIRFVSFPCNFCSKIVEGKINVYF